MNYFPPQHMKYSVSHSLNFHTATLFLDLLIGFTNEIVSNCQHHTPLVFNKDVLSDRLMPLCYTYSWIFCFSSFILFFRVIFHSFMKKNFVLCLYHNYRFLSYKRTPNGILNRLNWRAFTFYNIESFLLLTPSAVFPAVTI